MANFSYNKTMLAGRLTADPELTTTPNGIDVCRFSVAVSRKAQKDKTDFFDVVAWRETAKLICKYFKKGSSIFVEGELQKRSYEDRQNITRWVTELIVGDVRFVDSKSEVEPAKAKPKMEDLQPVEEFDLPF